LPKNLLGKWCTDENADNLSSKWDLFLEPSSSEHYNFQRTVVPKDANGCDELYPYAIEIKQDEIVIISKEEEYSCDFTEVKNRFDPTIPASTKTAGVWVTYIKSKCEVAGCTWRFNFQIYNALGAVQMHGRNTKRDLKERELCV
jgi:hypothetical protein